MLARAISTLGLSGILIAGAALTGCCCGPLPTPTPGGPCGFAPCPGDSGPFVRPDARIGPVPVDLCTATSFGGRCEGTCPDRLSCFLESSTQAMPREIRSADAGVADDAAGSGGGAEDAGVDAGDESDAGGGIDAGEEIDGGEAIDAGEELDGGEPLDAGEAIDASSDDAGPATGPILDVVGFPGGLCSIACAGDADCGACATCVPHVLAGRARLRGLVSGPGVCRPRCEPDFGDGCQPGYACDRATRACLEACTSDVQCRFRTEDVDGDGDDDILVYEDDPGIVCNAATGQCDAPRPAIGGPCFDVSACEPGYRCVGGSAAGPGRCALACVVGAVACSDGAICVHDAGLGADVCASPCELGAEPPEDVVGSLGHGAGCPVGMMCDWAGGGPTEGACVPGRYNDLSEPNTGAPCNASGECWSPYGRGLCLEPHARSFQGVCVVTDCVDGPSGPRLEPGVDVDVARFCDPARGLSCVPLITPESETACVQACTSAEECLPGWACTRLLGTEQRACAPNCEVDSDCTAGGSCRYTDTTACGTRPGDCFCR